MPTRRSSSPNTGRSGKSSASKTAGKSRTSRPGDQGGARRSQRKGKTIQEETEIGEDYESGRRDALP